MSVHLSTKAMGKKLYSLSVGFFFRRRGSASAMILAGRRQRRNPCEVRSSLSQSPSRCTSLQPAGRKTATRSSYADARFVNRIRLSVTDVAASRPTTSITIGLGSVAAAAQAAGRPSLFFRCFLFLTRTTVCWHAARLCSVALGRPARGRRHCRRSWTLIVCPIPPLCAAGRAVWTAPRQRISFSTRPSPA